MNARELFTKHIKGRNFITPNVLEYISIPNGAVELSVGKGIFSRELYGVTVVKDDNKNEELSTCFRTMEEAVHYIEQLKEN